MSANLHQSGARLSVRDVTELNDASEALAVVAEQVKRANPGWGPAVVQLLIHANTTIVRIQTKGARAFATWLEKHQPKGAPADAGELELNESETGAPRARLEEEP